MSDPRDMSVEDEDQLYREFASFEQRRNQYRATATPDAADILDKLVRNAPHVEPGVALAAAQAVRGGQMTFDDAVQVVQGSVKAAIETAPQPAQQGQNRSIFGRVTNSIQEGFKSGIKWGVAGLEFVPQVLTSFGARAYSGMGSPGDDGQYTGPKTGLWDGLIASTDFGSMLSGAESGNGYFIGEAALERQQRAVRDYRGTIDGEAWTFGRGFAVSVSQPGSREYNILSGLVDAAAAIAIPSVPGGKLISAGLTKGADLAGMRRVSGLSNFSTPYINRSKVESWVNSNSGRAVQQRIAEVKTIQEAKQLFPKADADWWLAVKEADEDSVGKLLRDNLGLDKPGLNRVDDLKVGFLDDARRKVSLKNRFSGRYSAIVPGEEFIVESSDMRDITKTVNNAEAYLRTVRAGDDARERIMTNLTRALVNNDRAAVRTTLQDLRTEVIAGVTKTKGVFARKADEDLLNQMFSKFDTDIDEYINYGFIDNVADPAEVDGLRYMVSGTAPGEVDIRTGGKLKLDTAHLETEAKKFSTYFPDPRKLRRVSSRYSFLWTKSAQNPELYGDARGFITVLDTIQNQVWRPMTLVTGGYMFRNMLESVMRQTTARGIASGPLHPIQWIQSMMGYKFIGDIEGTPWMGEAARMARGRNREFFEATGAKIRELQDPVYFQQRSLRTGRFLTVKRPAVNPGDTKAVPLEYAKGVATEIRLLAGDAVARKLAQGQTSKQIVDEFLTQSNGEKYVRDLQSRWTNRKLIGDDGIETQGTVMFRNADGTYDIDNLYAYVDSVKRRLDLKTGGYDSLVSAIANAQDLGMFVGRNGKQVRAFDQIVARSTPDDSFEAFEYTDDFLEEIRTLAADADTRLPDFAKIAPRLEQQMVAGKSKFEWFDKTLNHFFGTVFGRKEAFLNRSPVFRQYYYKKLNDLVAANELSQEALIMAYNGIAEGGWRYFSDKVTMLEAMKPNKAGKYTWDGRLLNERQYKSVLSNAKKDLTKASKRIDAKDANMEIFEILDDDWAARYVGSKELWQKIKDAKQGRYVAPKRAEYARLEAIQPNAKGRYLVDGKELTSFQYNQLLREAGGLSAEQASIAAKAFAFEETKRVFYNAAEVNNFTDIMRIVVPFGPAWAEAMRFYGKEVLAKPNRTKNLAVSVQGIRDADPDGDGKGFFYTDPVTGEMMFNYPFAPDMLPIIGAIAGGIGFETLFGASRAGGRIAAAGALFGGLAGAAGKNLVEDRLGDATFTLSAPAQSVSQSFQVMPGIGPVVQMAASKLLGDKPAFDDVLQVIAPFGSFSDDPLSSLVPSWAGKFAEAITADPESDRFFADLYIDSYRAIYATGIYDNTNSEDMRQLRLRAREAARTLLVLRSLGQFVGPARPKPTLIVPTKFEGQLTVKDVDLVVKNNIPSAVLASVFREMQEEDYENAVTNFLQTFGDDTMLYLPGLSDVTVQGLEATDLFGDWERRNGEVINAYPTVYGYFATPGGEFELQTYLRQLRTGARERTTDPAILQADAEAVVGKALYINAVRQMGDDISPETRAELRQYRTELEKKLPGFQFQALNINERDQILNQIIEAAQESPFLEDNAVAKAIRVYAGYRQEATEQAIVRNDGVDTGSLLKRADNADLRQWLREVGDTLIQRYPEFERVWTRVLFDEVDL